MSADSHIDWLQSLSHADLQKVTRLEVISDQRELVRHDIELRGALLQDDGRTLKLFIDPETSSLRKGA